MTAWAQWALYCQGLDRQAPFGYGLEGTRQAIAHLGYVQVDTIHVVERAHHHVLWSRVPDYQPDFLNTLLAQREVFEHWAHAAAYLPMRDFRFALPRMRRVREGKHPWFDVDERLLARILQQVREEGPLRLRDVHKQAGDQSGTWWNWGAERRALDKLFLQGDVMVCARQGMEKTFELTERFLPASVDRREPDVAEYAAYLLEGGLRAHGVVTLAQLLHLQSMPGLKKALQEMIAARVAEGRVIALAQWRETYADARWLEQEVNADDGVLRVLSPFDNVLIHRARLQQLFGFDYRLECYLPKNKRQFGYFALPLLFAGRFVGRVDCKAQRKEKCLQVMALQLEQDAPERERLAAPLREGLQALAQFNGCTRLEVAEPLRWFLA